MVTGGKLHESQSFQENLCDKNIFIELLGLTLTQEGQSLMHVLYRLYRDEERKRPSADGLTCDRIFHVSLVQTDTYFSPTVFTPFVLNDDLCVETKGMLLIHPSKVHFSHFKNRIHLLVYVTYLSVSIAPSAVRSNGSAALEFTLS